MVHYKSIRVRAHRAGPLGLSPSSLLFASCLPAVLACLTDTGMTAGRMAPAQPNQQIHRPDTGAPSKRDATDGFRSPSRVCLLSARHDSASKQTEPIVLVLTTQLHACSVSNLQRLGVVKSHYYILLFVATGYYQHIKRQ
jgi:hypothetical protein